MQAVIDAISNPRRREILRLVWDRELAAGEIARQFEVTWAATSQNLAVLRRAGLVRERRVGNRRFYAADRAALGPLAAVIESMWRTDLERLRDVLARGEPPGGLDPGADR